MRLHLLAIAASAALVLLLPTAASAQLAVQEVSLLVFENEFDGVPEGWVFQVEIEGAGITAATITPPGQSAINLQGDSTDRGFESDPFASFSALQNEFSPSDVMDKYVITLNGTTELNLDFQPVPPNGFGRFTSPTHESATLDTTPTFTVTNGCSNCNVQVVFVEDLAFNMTQIESFEFGPPFLTSLDLSDFSPVLPSLPLDPYEACVSAANGSIDPAFSDGGHTFQLTRAAVAEECIEFDIVPPPDVDAVEIALGEGLVDGGSLGWFFGVGVTGTDVLAASLTPPGGAPLPLQSFGPDEFSLFVGPFGSLGDLQASFPPDASGGYLIELNGGVSTVGLDFDPLVPDGFPVITSPTPDGVVGSQPSFVFTNSCTNCAELFAGLDDENTGGGLVSQGAVFGTPLPTTIDYADFGPNEGSLGSISELPDAFYEIVIEAANETMTSESFTPADDFDLFSGAFRGDFIRFEVPEPAAGVLAIAALATLAGLRRRHSRGG